MLFMKIPKAEYLLAMGHTVIVYPKTTAIPNGV